jgi:integrase
LHIVAYAQGNAKIAKSRAKALKTEFTKSNPAILSSRVKVSWFNVPENISSGGLRRHAATFASRCGTPIEIVSKVIMRHAHLSTTQRYLGKVTDVEAMRWIENLYG